MDRNPDVTSPADGYAVRGLVNRLTVLSRRTIRITH